MSDARRTVLAGGAWALGALACLGAAVLPPSSVTWMVVVLGTEVVATIVLGAAVLRMRGGARTVWGLLWGYQFLTVAGDAVFDVQITVLQVPAFPGPADAAYLGAYAALIAGLVLLVHRQHPGRDREAWIDSAIMTGAAASVVGAFVVVPLLGDSATPALDTAIAVTYPLLDLVALSVLTRLMIGRPRRQWCLSLLTAAVATTLVADFAYNLLVINGVEEDSLGWVEALFLLGVLLVTAAGTSPDAARLADPVVRENPRVSTSRVIGLSVGVLTAPILLAVVAWGQGGARAQLLAVTSVLVIALVLWRTLILLATVQRQSEALAQQARTDPLTGVANRRTWDFQLERAITMAAAAGHPLTVAMLDLDHFKDYNDRFGHQAGDDMLVRCVRAWASQLPRTAFLARYGGEEFALLLPLVAGADVVPALDRVRTATPDGQTVSIGSATLRPDETSHEVVARSDRALYAAKATGRDRVVDAEGPLPDLDRATADRRTDAVTEVS